MCSLTLIRGLPGSGKSTRAKEMVDANPMTTVHVEADMWFVEDGEYKFDPTELGKAHTWCQNITKYHLLDGKNVVVANTFTMIKEMQSYIDFANSKGIKLEIITCTGDYGSIHDVPGHAIERMKDRWEDFVLVS